MDEKELLELRDKTAKLEKEVNTLHDVVEGIADAITTKELDGMKRNDHDLDSMELGSASKDGKIKCYIDTTKDGKEEIHRRIDLLTEGLEYATGGGGK